MNGSILTAKREQDAAKKDKDAAIAKLKEEAQKLGVSLEDLQSSQGW